MPKKEKKPVKKIEKDKKNIIKLNDFELEEILQEKNNESEEKLKQKKVEIKSLKEIKPIDLDTFQEFFSPKSKFTAPVLTKVEQVQEIINLEKGISTSPRLQKTKENEDAFKYSAGNANQEDKKYISSNSHMTEGVARLEFEKIGKEKNKLREAQFMQSSELQGVQNLNQEKYTMPKGINPQDLGKENLFGTKEINRKKMDYEPLH